MHAWLPLNPYATAKVASPCCISSWAVGQPMVSGTSGRQLMRVLCCTASTSPEGSFNRGWQAHGLPIWAPRRSLKTVKLLLYALDLLLYLSCELLLLRWLRHCKHFAGRQSGSSVVCWLQVPWLDLPQSGSMWYALQRLARNAAGVCAQLQAKFKGLLCEKSVPMMRQLSDALVLPTVSYDSEVWGVGGPSCSLLTA